MTEPQWAVFNRDGTPTVRLTDAELTALQHHTPEGKVIQTVIQRQLDARGLSYVAWERIVPRPKVIKSQNLVGAGGLVSGIIEELDDGTIAIKPPTS